MRASRISWPCSFRAAAVAEGHVHVGTIARIDAPPDGPFLGLFGRGPIREDHDEDALTDLLNERSRAGPMTSRAPRDDLPEWAGATGSLSSLTTVV